MSAGGAGDFPWGDPSGILAAELMQKHRDDLLGLAFNVLGAQADWDTAEGVVQDAWLAVAEAAPDLPQSEEGRRALLFAFVAMTAKNRRRYEAVRETETLERAEREGDFGGTGKVVVWQPTPRPEIGPALAEALATLTPSEKRVVELRYLEGCSVKEVAAIRGSAERTVKELIRRARRKLQCHFSAEDVP